MSIFDLGFNPLTLEQIADLKLILANLKDYSERGIKIWFARKHKTLKNKSPYQLLSKNWVENKPIILELARKSGE